MRLIHGRHHTRTTHRRTPATRPPTRQDQRPVTATAALTPARHHQPRTSRPCRSVPTSSPRRRSAVLLALSLTAAGLLLTGSAAHAETVQYIALAQTLDQVLTNIRNWIMGILAGVALVFLTLGGLRYLMASTDPGETEKAKGAFKAAGIGFGLAALAPIVVEILKTIVGGV
jgi:hypothetical protein